MWLFPHFCTNRPVSISGYSPDVPLFSSNPPWCARSAFDDITFAKRTLRELKILRHLRHENLIDIRWHSVRWLGGSGRSGRSWVGGWEWMRCDWSGQGKLPLLIHYSRFIANVWISLNIQCYAMTGMGDEEMDEWGVWFLIVQSLTGGCIFLAPPPCREVCVLTRPEIQFRGRADCLPRGHHTLKKGRLVYTNYATLGTNPKPRLHAMFLARTCMVNRQHVSFFSAGHLCDLRVDGDGSGVHPEEPPTALGWALPILHLSGWERKADGSWEKQDAAHEPECSHVEHFCQTSYLNSLHFSPVTVPVHCRLWIAEEGGVQTKECRV